MAMTQNGTLMRDDNDNPVMGGTSSVDDTTIINAAFDPVTRRLLTDQATGGGTVETVSIATANGFAGTSDGDPTDPELTISTTVTGIVKGNGTALSAAVANTDYQTPVALTVLGTSGAATFNGTTLNIPQYQAAGTYVTSVSGTADRITSSGGTTPVIDISASYVGQATITTLGTIATGTWQGTTISTTYTQAKLISLTGTSNRITIGGTATDPTVDIADTYVGQNTITTLGTITTGVWNGTLVAGQYGGTGVANTGKTITVSGNTILGSNTDTLTLTTAGNTNVTLPTSGTLAILSGDIWTGVHDFGGATSLEIPNSAAPTVDADGEIAVDTSVADFSTGVIKFYGLEEQGVVSMPIAEFSSPSDGDVVTYNATADEFQLTQPSGGTNIQEFSSGTSNWNKPSGTPTWVFVEVWGAGGSGGVSFPDNTAGQDASTGGGGGGEYRSAMFPASTFGSTVSVTIGTGGTAVSRTTQGSTNGNAGGNTSFGAFLVANGGSAGSANTANNGSASGGAGGTGGGGTPTYLSMKTEAGAAGGGGNGSGSGTATAGSSGTYAGSGGGGSAINDVTAVARTAAGGTSTAVTSVGGASASTYFSGGPGSTVTATSGTGVGAGGGSASITAVSGGSPNVVSGAGSNGFCRVTTI